MLFAYTVCFALLAVASIPRAHTPRSLAVSGYEAALVAALFVLGPGPAVVAASFGLLAGQLARRVRAADAVAATAARASSTIVAAGAFAVIGRTDRTDLLAAVTAVAAVVFASTLDAVVHRITDAGERTGRALASGVRPTVLTALAVAPLGFMVLSLGELGTFGPVLVAPVVIAAVLAGRRAATVGDEHRRGAQLLAATARIARLRSFEDALAAVGREVREMSDATVALCCAVDPRGEWVGVLVDGDGTRPATADTVAAVLELAAEAPRAREVDLRDRLRTTRLAFPPAKSVVLSPAAPDAAVPIVLAAFRDVRPTKDSTRAATLASFSSSAALSVANARLYGEVDDAYRQQLDVSRQKGEFVATVSHELRTPVAAIIGTIETVARLGDRLDDERRAGLLAGAVEYGERLSRVIEELLLVAAAEQSTTSVHVGDVELGSFVERILDETAALTDRRVVANIRPAAGRIRTDEQKLHRILVNLIENATKYAPSGPIEIEAMAAGSRALFFVTDHGPGIASNDRARVFERFVQLDQSLTRRQGGLGLGLYLCRQLVELLDGELVLTETPGGGCSFCVAVSRELVGTDGAETPRPAVAGGVLRRPVEASAPLQATG